MFDKIQKTSRNIRPRSYNESRAYLDNWMYFKYSDGEDFGDGRSFESYLKQKTSLKTTNYTNNLRFTKFNNTRNHGINHELFNTHQAFNYRSKLECRGV